MKICENGISRDMTPEEEIFYKENAPIEETMSVEDELKSLMARIKKLEKELLNNDQ